VCQSGSPSAAAVKGHGHTSDEADAVSVAVPALNAARLRSAQIEDSILALRAVVDHRDDLIKQRTQTVNRPHVLLARPIDFGASTQLSAKDAALILRPPTTSQAMLRSVAPRPGRRATAAGHPHSRRGKQINTAASAGSLPAKSWPTSAPSNGSTRPRRSPCSTEPHRSRCPPVTSSGIDSREPGIGNSTMRYT
jgi:hypothetical protein